MAITKPEHGTALMLLALSSLPVMVGCGGGTDEPFTRAAVEGTVTLDGQPLDDATIRFVPSGQTSGPKTRFPVAEGRFVTTTENGPPLGSHRVEIKLRDNPQFAHDDEELVAKLASQRQRRIPVKELPDRYHRRSELSIELTGGADGKLQQVEFALQSR